MKRIAVVAALAMALGACTESEIVVPSTREIPAGVSYGFDESGYNDVANVFVGTADGVDRVLDGLSFGQDTPYDEDRLVMKWNRSWELCNADRTVANCTGAWLTNQWNGMGPGGSDETWHYAFKWVGTCVDGTTLANGGYCIWGEYEVVRSQGTAGGHFWDVRGTPAGLGIK